MARCWIGGRWKLRACQDSFMIGPTPASIARLPAKQRRELARSLPFDRSGSHYFSARDTDADYVRVNSLVATNPLPEHEQFIFYRGVGNFATPLRVTMNAGSAVTLANTCQAP